jgi:diguanylate cyclase (GGDEF)-like protein
MVEKGDVGGLGRTVLTVAAGLALVTAVGFVDFLTGPEISLSVFYLVPVGLVSWNPRRWPGVAVAAASSGVWLVADVGAGHVYSSPAIPYWNAFVRLAIFIIVALVVSELKTSFDREKKRARVDYLTDLFNRRGFAELAAREIARAKRYKRPFSVLYMDLDNFKAVNDAYGHREGDSVLAYVARTIKENVREIDVVARLGGDEFGVFLTEADPDGALSAAERLRERLVGALKERRWPVTPSIGVVTYEGVYPKTDEMIKTVDELMYAVKKAGKGAVKYEVVSQ